MSFFRHEEIYRPMSSSGSVPGRPLFWGLAIQAYEATLIANDSRVDQFLDGDTEALTLQEHLGRQVFEGKGRCINCHGGAETTNASVANVIKAQELLERMVMGNGGIAVYDNGFYNTALRQRITRSLRRCLANPQPLQPNEREAVDGAFKTPGLRNIELIAPYFHNGGT